MKIQEILPIISALGFGVQQFLQVLADPLISILISKLKHRFNEELPDGTIVLPGGISDVDAKKALLGLVSVSLGLMIASAAPTLRILQAVGLTGLDWWDWFITALTISAGTEGANSILKLMQYVKDAVKTRTPPSVAQNSPVPQSPAGKVTSDESPTGSDSQADIVMTPNSGDDEDAETEDEDTADAGEEPDIDALISGLGAITAGVPSWRTARSLDKLLAQVNERAPHRSKASDGTIGDAAHASRQSDHNPWVKDGHMGVVTALDITHDPARGCDADVIAESLRGSQDDRIKYIIRNRRIAWYKPIGGNSAWAWRKYHGKNPHVKHVHISVKSDKPHYDSTTTWSV